MKKILKTIIIGGAIYGGLDLMLFCGKAHMLSILAKYDMDPNETIDQLKSENGLILKFIGNFAEFLRDET